MNKYYEILEVSPKANLAQIKRAYRTMAKRYHPDINKDEDAHDKFILLNEAYEYLVKVKDLNSDTRNKKTSRADLEKFWKAWQQEEKRKARERAQAYARMRYEAYLKSDLYRTTEAVNSVVDFIATAFILAFVILLPVLSYIEHGLIALILASIIILPTSPLWFRFLVKTFNKDAFLSFFSISHSSIKSKVIRLILFTVLNAIIFFNIVLNSLVPLRWIVLLYVGAFLFTYLITRKIASRYRRYLLRYIVAPGLISCIFAINFAFAHSPKVESYWYTYHVVGGRRLLSSIQLDGGKYDQYKGMRFFSNFDPFIGKSCVSYTISEGLLGIRVVKKVDIGYDFPNKD